MPTPHIIPSPFPTALPTTIPVQTTISPLSETPEGAATEGSATQIRPTDTPPPTHHRPASSPPMRLYPGRPTLPFTTLVLLAALALQAPSQQPPPPKPPAPTPPPAFQLPEFYPGHKVDPAKAERGKVIFGVNCAFCHGNDARGGEGGPNLIRSELVLKDKDGETISPTILNGRPDRGMPKFNFTAEQISEIAAYIHSFKVGGYDAAREKPPSILVGNATAGRATFEKMCASCHSITGDLKGFAASAPDPRTLQQTWIMPGMRSMFGPSTGAAKTHVPPITVTVTQASGETVQGQLERIDDFFVTLKDADGYERTFRRDSHDVPKIEIHNPLAPHIHLLAEYTDKEIHDITAYLETTK